MGTKLNDNMVADEIGNSFEQSELLADVALELENNIKKLTELELKNKNVIETMLVACFEDKKGIEVMVKGENPGALVDEIMELIREVYL